MQTRKKRIFLATVLAVGLVLTFFISPVSADNQPPQADFDWSPKTNLQTNQQIAFEDESTDPDGFIQVREWNFGDGSQKVTGTNPVHTYTDDGTYDVTLTVYDNNGSTDSVTKQITINNRPPVADAGPNQLVNHLWALVDGTGSSDPDGSISTYTWDFDDGDTAGGATVNHTYDEDGSYTVTLNVTDDDGASDQDSTQITVDTTPPRTNVTLNGTEGEHGWYTDNVTVTLDAEDNTSGVDTTYYKINDGNWTEYQTKFKVRTEGNNTIRYYSTDDAGNTEPTKNVSFGIDKTEPTVTIDSPEEGYIYLFGRQLLPTIRGRTYSFGRITIEVTVNAAPSGVDKVRFLVDGEVEYTDFEAPYSWQWGRALGGHNLGVKAIDMAGQEATAEQYITIFSLLAGDGSVSTNDTDDATANYCGPDS
ncbi:MAG: PKD domain-containing protein [Thermoplasmatota archaeon]